jgi:hypothetical protein
MSVAEELIKLEKLEVEGGRSKFGVVVNSQKTFFIWRRRL